MAFRPSSLLAVVAGVVITAGLVVFVRHRAVESLKTQQGAPEGSFVVRSSSAYLVLVDRVKAGRASGAMASGTRLTALDAATGEQAGLQVLDAHVTCWPASAGRAWCEEVSGGLRLFEVPRLAQVAEVDALVTKAGFAAPVHGQWRREEDDVAVMLPDGRWARVAAASLAVSEAAAKDGPRHPSRDVPTTTSFKLGDGYLVFGEGPRHPLLRAAERNGARPPVPEGAPVFLQGDGPPDFLVLEDASMAVVVSRASLEHDAPTVLSRVDQTPKVLWSAEPGGSLEHVELVGGSLVVATRNPAARARVLDAATGAARWTFGR